MPMTATEVRERRQQLGLTQSELGKRLGVSERTVARWETNGVTGVTQWALGRLLADMK